jgi:hypothetical protein
MCLQQPFIELEVLMQQRNTLDSHFCWRGDFSMCGLRQASEMSMQPLNFGLAGSVQIVPAPRVWF